MAKKHGRARTKILFVDDDRFLSIVYVDALRDEGYEVVEASGVDSAISLARDRDFDAVILDIMLPPGRSFTNLETQGGFKTGIALARRLREMLPAAGIVALTMSTDPEVQEWFTSDDTVAYADKKSVLPNQLARIVKNLLEGNQSPRVFVVHGRDSAALSELKKFLINGLCIPNPIILAEQPSKGKTIIEKFEHHAHNVDLVFVLATRDDFGRLAKARSKELPRSRQNVVFELGYFLGKLKRNSGRVILLYERGIELPSDISGVVYIDISRGFDSAEPEIRREIGDWIT
jgi:predicted nucleotide-binding protein